LNRAFTLIEVLAATAILSAVAAAVIPVTMRMGSQQVRLDQRQRARLLIDTLLLRPMPAAGEQVALADGWWCGVELLHTEVPATTMTVPHTWQRVRICRGPPTDPEVLAERLVVRVVSP